MQSQEPSTSQSSTGVTTSAAQARFTKLQCNGVSRNHSADTASKQIKSGTRPVLSPSDTEPPPGVATAKPSAQAIEEDPAGRNKKSKKEKKEKEKKDKKQKKKKNEEKSKIEKCSRDIQQKEIVEVTTVEHKKDKTRKTSLGRSKTSKNKNSDPDQTKSADVKSDIIGAKCEKEADKSNKSTAGGRRNAKNKDVKESTTGCLGCLSRKGHLASMEDDHPTEEATTSATRILIKNHQLATELRSQNFDVVRFATYRTACKLRFIQKKTNLCQVDIWNVIEAFRENGMNSLEHHTEIAVSKLEALLSTIFYQLNKRLSTNSQIDADESIILLQNWLLSVYEADSKGQLRVFSIKASLSMMCSGKLTDKLRYVFTQISDSNGFLVHSKLDSYLKEVLALPTAVYEGPSFGYKETAASCFEGKTKVTVNDFLDTLMAEPGLPQLLWVSVLHRMAAVEKVFHPVQCETCQRESILGFRYKCQRCYNYHLCQDCFWRGKTSGNHHLDHHVKEYTSYKSPAKQLGHTLRKSLRCVPTKTNHEIPRFPETPEKTLDLTHIVPPTPPPVHNGFRDQAISHHSLDVSSMDGSVASKSCSPSHILSVIDGTRVDDEHRLIARYAARLAADVNNAARSPTELNYSLEASRSQRDLIAHLESKNREILREIQRLRVEHEAHVRATPEAGQRNPTLLAELRLLRQRRDELEARMAALQESRRELMVQLEGLMKLLKNHGSPRSTPNSSPRSRHAQSPPLTTGARGSAPSTPGDSLSGVGGDVRQAFVMDPGTSTTSSLKSLRNDLLVAADSVANAMSSLVKELNSEASSGSDEEQDCDKSMGEGAGTEEAWQEEMTRRLQQETEFMRQLRARKEKSKENHNRNTEHAQYIPAEDGESYVRTDDDSYAGTDDGESCMRTDEDCYMRTDEEDAELYDQPPKELVQHRYTTDEESCLETDQESYIRTDDEEGGSTEWEEAMHRWVNR